VTERPDLQSIFEAQSAVGTFVVRSVETGQVVVVGAKRAEQRYIPASTFKIINSLIALSEGVVENENEILPFGGKPQRFKVWEQDMSLRQAIRVSNVPVFQQLAKKIGLDTYRVTLRAFGYGNQEIGQNVETFWLKGPLKISALEQVEVLGRLVQNTLPVPAKHQETVRHISILERRGDAVLYGKTGWTSTPNPDIGWFVGWVEKGGKTHTFALNMDIQSRLDIKKRKSIAKQALSHLGLW